MAKWLNIQEAGCLQVGDIIETPSILVGPLVKHYGIILEVCKTLYVCHLPGIGIPVLESLESFEKKHRILRIIRTESTKALTNAELINNYHTISKRKYSFLGWNCEDFIRHMTKGNIDIGFDQMQGFSYLIVAVLVIIFLIIFLKK